MKIIKADHSHISLIAPLFDEYRVFYKQASNITAAIEFLDERLTKDESLIFLALKGNQPIGFVQLYTSFSSVSLQPIFILNDLYVATTHRSNGIGEALLSKAKDLCIEKGYKGVALETGTDNPAQQLYEKLNWKKDIDSFHYFWSA